MGLDTKTLSGLDDVLDKLKALPPEIASKNGGIVRKALRKGAVVIQKQAKANIRKVTQNLQAKGYPSTRTLERAVVVRRSSNPKRYGADEVVSVRVSGKKYPGRDIDARPVGRYLERGTEKQPAEPWMTPAYFAQRDRALTAVVDELNDGIAAAIAKISKGA